MCALTCASAAHAQDAPPADDATADDANESVVESFAPNTAFDDDWGNDDAQGARWSGYVEAAASARRHRDPAFDDRATRSELKLQLEVARTVGAAEFSARLDIRADAIDDALRFDLREAMVSVPLGDVWNLQAGRQIATWGTGDLLFINDRFPKDFVAPLGGSEDYYLKSPSNTLRLSGAWRALNLDLAYTPTFTPDRYIDGRRLGFYDPRIGARIGGGDRIDARHPAATLANGEWALRAYRTSAGVEYAMYLNRGFDKQPRAATLDGTPTFLRRDAAGLSVRGPLGGGIATFEAVREWPRVEHGEAAAWVPHKRVGMIAYEKEWWPKLTIGAQLYGERHAREAGNASPLNGESRSLVSLRISRQAMRDKLTMSAIQFYSPNQHDRWLRVTAQYRFNDRWLAGASANVFGGRIDRFFGQLEPDTNAGVWVRRQF